jgi:alpha-glucosidase
MEHIPLYARGGAVIPMWPKAPASTAGHHPQAIELHVFVPGADGTHRAFLQEDDGVTDAAGDGARLRTSLELVRTGAALELRAEVEGDGYPEFARERLELVVHGAAPRRVVVDGEEVPGDGGRFGFANAGTAFTARIEL